jgi:hypothetical protein
MGKLRDFTSENLENNCVYTFQYIYIGIRTLGQMLIST